MFLFVRKEVKVMDKKMFVTSLIFKKRGITRYISWNHNRTPCLIRLIHILKKKNLIVNVCLRHGKNTLQWDISFSNQLKIMSLPKGSTIILLCSVTVWYRDSEYVYSFYQVVLKWYSYTMHMFQYLHVFTLHLSYCLRFSPRNQ